MEFVSAMSSVQMVWLPSQILNVAGLDNAGQLIRAGPFPSEQKEKMVALCRKVRNFEVPGIITMTMGEFFDETERKAHGRPIHVDCNVCEYEESIGTN